MFAVHRIKWSYLKMTAKDVIYCISEDLLNFANSSDFCFPIYQKLLSLKKLLDFGLFAPIKHTKGTDRYRMLLKPKAISRHF